MKRPSQAYEALDRALWPLRRASAWVRAHPEQGGDYFAVNGRRWVDTARALKLPPPVPGLLEELAEQLTGTGTPADQASEVYQTLARIDALLGLPLSDVRLKRIPPRPLPPAKASPEPPPERSAKPAAPKAQVEPKPEDRPERPRSWSGNPDQPLAEVLSEPLADVAARLSEAGIQTVRELLWRNPSELEELSVTHAGQAWSGRVALSGRAVGRFTRLAPSGARTQGVVLSGEGTQLLDLDGSVEVSDQRVLVLADSEGGRARLLEMLPPSNAPRLARYDIDGVTDAEIRRVLRALEAGLSRLQDPILDVGRPFLPPGPSGRPIAWAEALRMLHQGGREATRRFAFDEALIVQLGAAYARYHGAQRRGIAHGIQHDKTGALSRQQAFLDDHQQLAFEDIKRDLRSDLPMRRVLVGDVGSGRSRIALAAASVVADAKSQVLYLGPSAASAELRFAYAEPFLRECGFVARLLEGRARNMADAVHRGEVHVVFGSMDMLEEGLDFRRLGLVVVEERSDFAGAQRVLEVYRRPTPDVLVIPSVPVGLDVTLAAYSDHDVTRVQAEVHPLPTIEVISADGRDKVYRRARRAIEEGRQAVIAFPMRRGADALDVRDAVRVVHALQTDVFSGLNVGLYHGALGREDRRRALDDFAAQRCQLLLATGAIEECPPVHGAAVLIIEQADRVEPIRMHRLRSFVARSAALHTHEASRDEEKAMGELLLVTGEVATDEDRARLMDWAEQTDGFALQRHNPVKLGPEVPSVPSLTWLEFSDHREMAWSANIAAHEVLRSDRNLRHNARADLAREVRALWSRYWPDVPCPLPEPSERSRRRRRRRRRR